MALKQAWIAVSVLAGALTGCTVQAYRAAPVAPASNAEALEARRLTEPALLAFLRANQEPQSQVWPPQVWTLGLLADAALYESPAMPVARAQAAAAAAAVITAGARPNPTLSVKPGVPSPWMLSLDWAIPIQTHNKRGLKVVAARRLDQAARFQLAQTAWQTRMGVRTALAAERAATAARTQQAALVAVERARVGLLTRRLAAGEIGRAAVAAARGELAAAQLTLQQDTGAVATARAGVAAAVGLPAAALTGVRLAWPGWNAPPRPASLSAAAVRRAAVVNRLDVRAALMKYQAAESALQLEIARQHPNFNIGPGYDYGEGNSYFTVGLSVTLPIFNHNQGPIAQAEARRQAAGAALLARQAAALAAGDQAWARYQGAYRAWRAAQAVVNARARQVAQARRARAAGETGPLAVNALQLQQAQARMAAAAALARVQQALGQLEDAVEQPLVAGDPTPLAPGAAALNPQRPEVNP